jgi:hypothetical protein
VNLTGWSAAMQIRNVTGGTILYDASSDIEVDGQDGTIVLAIPASVTEAFALFSGVYDLLLTDLSGNVTKFVNGIVTVMPGVTP